MMKKWNLSPSTGHTLCLTSLLTVLALAVIVTKALMPAYILPRITITALVALSLAAMVLGLMVCYGFGTAWFLAAYARTTGPVGLWTALGLCVFPFIVPDLAKLALALALSRRLARYLK